MTSKKNTSQSSLPFWADKSKKHTTNHNHFTTISLLSQIKTMNVYETTHRIGSYMIEYDFIVLKLLINIAIPIKKQVPWFPFPVLVRQAPMDWSWCFLAFDKVNNGDYFEKC